MYFFIFEIFLNNILDFDFLYFFYFFFISFFILKFLWDVTLPFWVIMRSGRWNAMNHIATKGTIFGRRGCGEFFYHESYYDESVIMTIYEFQIFCDLSFGWWGYALIWHMGTPQRCGFLGCLKLDTPYYWCL